MSVFGLIKTSFVCACIAFLVYSFPVMGQILIIGVLSLLWVSCAHQTVRTVWRRWSA